MPETKTGRNYYLSDIPLDEAAETFWHALESAGALTPAAPETLPLDRAHGRVTAEAVWARVSSPHYDAAAMDGIAVRSTDTVGATETAPLRLDVGRQARWVDTGDPLPDGFDAVVMLEHVHEAGESSLEIQASVAPYQHVRTMGEDIVATELVLPESHRLRPPDIGACAAAGLAELAVRAKSRVAIIPTGSELVAPGVELKPGDIVEYNSLMLAAMVNEWGGEGIRRPPVADEPDKLKDAIQQALELCDVLVVNAGSAAGAEDYTAALVEDLGELLVHGVAIRPGHPVVLGLIEKKPVLGIPGYPVSAVLTAETFLRPLVERKLGLGQSRRDTLTANITRSVLSPVGEDEFLRVRVGRVGEKTVATPMQRGAGVIMSLVRADGLVKVPRFSEGLEAGDQVTVELLRPAHEIDGTIVAIGSHDLTLDLLASLLHAANPDLALSSSNVGSLGGLIALSRGEAHLAGSHLLDEESGEYNLPFVRRYLGKRRVVLINLVRREQGLIVPAGNPKGIESLDDLTGKELVFVNRQRGSGTRVLLDYRLREAGIAPDRIRGYERDEYTHLAVAATVKAGNADAGLGILSAARAMGVDFVPLATEQFDLVIPKEFYEADLLRPLLSLVRSGAFKTEVDGLGGYDTSTTGELIAELGADG